jgi:hypothetical protein
MHARTDARTLIHATLNTNTHTHVLTNRHSLTHYQTDTDTDTLTHTHSQMLREAVASQLSYDDVSHR